MRYRSDKQGHSFILKLAAAPLLSRGHCLQSGKEVAEKQTKAIPSLKSENEIA